MPPSTPTNRVNALAIRSGRTPFEAKLIADGQATQEQFDQARKKSQESGITLVAALEDIIGQALAPGIVRFYKQVNLFELKILYGLESIDPAIEIEKFNPAKLSELIEANVVPIATCREYQVLPLSKDESSLLVALVSPANSKADTELKRIADAQKLSLKRRVISQEDFLTIFDQIIDLQVTKSKSNDSVSEKDLEIADFDEGASLSDVSDPDDDLDKSVGENSAPIIKLVDQILVRALKEGVSDIHIEPQEKELRIRFRKDGVLRPMITDEDKQLPRKIVNAVTSRFKIISDLNIAERRKPQDGKLKRNFQGRRVDFRVSTLPTPYGEKIVLRILDNSNTQLGLDKLITDPESLKIMQDMARRPFGLILVTGPTGSGKTTTLYSTLAEANDPGINISTAEDPIEYSLPGLTQCQVIRDKGMDFPMILRAFLRQDPDVILVGETRDKETAKTAIEAALTGHLVLTTLHTNDAPSAIARLDEMGVEPFMTSTALIGVLAQRLLRKVCDNCRIPYNPSKEEIEQFGLPKSDMELTFYKANTIGHVEIAAAKAGRGRVCPKCGGNGYKGRVGCYEIMKMTERLQSAINKGATTDAIKEIAVAEGMKTLMAYSFDLVREGRTTLEEVLRVTYTDKGREAEERAKRKTSLECTTCHAILKPEMIECPYCTTVRDI
ncbi:type II secretory pathway, ATPase PulE/Tfp pilus assembly pathway, ATPase PilB [Synechococcus sp. PCC 7502]|uniref:GspE/PulE family protein n=1 Tax=Synechococcus sp. PCC 7502 TaxID=1173263 RepID=UPI00029FC9D7|nr:GspE/PulE family protein [Synechococcus sp. PCC 7502]AFY72762.1 type II secretory pathway, ATPase PulE/Tfp pilus assembly pathway, ATPase PilB [Synechococcus sp. PCC 7502]